MRKLTIKRGRSFAASLIKLKVYIEEPSISDRVFTDEKISNSWNYFNYTPKYLRINGINCRFLGTLKNGEKKEFTIGENPMRLFIIASAFDKETFHSSFDICGGKDDVFLSGKNTASPINGNPFVFDGEQMPRIPKPLKQKYISVIIISTVIAALASFLYVYFT